MNLNNNFENVQGVGQNFTGAKIDSLSTYFVSPLPHTSLKLDKAYTFSTHRNVLDKQTFLYSSTIFIIFSFFSSIFIYFWAELATLQESFYSVVFFIWAILSVLFISLYLIVASVVAALCQQELTISAEGLNLNNQNLEFNKIRSVLTLKDLKGWSIYIYGNTQIEPIFDFNVKSIHDVIAIKELIVVKLNEENMNSNQENKRI